MNLMRIATCSLFAATLFAPAAHAHGFPCAHPFQHTGTVVIGPGFTGTVGEFQVLADTRLQIEYVSASVRLGNAGENAAFSIGTTASGIFAWHPLPVDAGYTAVDRLGSQAVALYGDSGTLVKIEISRGSSVGEATGRYAVSGCLYRAR